MTRATLARMIASIALGVALLLAAAPAGAQNEARLRALFSAGAQAYKQGKFLAAVHAFEEAYKLSPRPPLLFSAAQALRRQYAVDGDVEHLVRALEHYRRYLELVDEGGRRLDAAKAIEEIQPIVEREQRGEGEPVEVAKPVTRLMITTAAPAAEVVLDGAIARKMPLIDEVAPGRHVVVVRAPGYRAVRREVVALEGAVVAFEVDLPEKPGELLVAGADGGELLIDGEPRGELPLNHAVELRPGRHVVTVLDRGHEPFTREIELERGQALTVDVSLSRTRLRSASYVVMAAGAAALVCGGVLTGVAVAKELEAKEIDEARASGQRRTEADRIAFNDALAARNDLRLAAGVTAGAGAVILGAGLALFFLDEPAAPPLRLPDEPRDGPAEEEGLEVSIDASPLLWGARLRGRF